MKVPYYIMISLEFFLLQESWGRDRPARCWGYFEILAERPEVETRKFPTGETNVQNAQTRLQHRLQHRELEEQRLFIKADTMAISRVEELNVPNVPGEGASNFGVFAMEMKDVGTVAIKVVDPASAAADDNLLNGTDFRDSKYFEALMIQKTLGDLGLAPKLYGVLNFEEFKTLYDTFQRHGVTINRAGPNKPAMALVMEKIEAPWNVPRLNAAPPWAAKWSNEQVESILTQMKHIEHVCNALNIFTDDVQFFIDPSGKVRLGDLDLYRMRQEGDGPNDFTSYMNSFLQSWERSSGQTFPKARFREITGSPETARFRRPIAP